MPEPTAEDVAAALKEVQRYCGWHVAPAEDHTLTLDGPGGPLLVLPTLHINTLTAVVEDGVELDVDYLSWSTDGRVRKKDNISAAWVYWAGRSYWWTSQYRGITVTFNHGFDAAEDFDKAVAMVAESLAASGLRDDQSMISKQVDDVRYQWSDTAVERIVGAHLLAPYRLEKTP